MGHRVQNFDALATNDLRLDALSIAEAGYAAIHVGNALERTMHVAGEKLTIKGKPYHLSGRRIFFVGVGKCAFAAAETIEKIFGDRLEGGVALDVSPLAGQALTKIETYVGTHPLPSEVNETATKRIVEFLADREEHDVVIMLISGGGSTLLCLHEAPMTCLDEGVLFGELTAKGATIQDINTVRKHISHARGGALASAAYPAEVISLIVSDVPGNDIEYIASGPTVKDSSTVADARAILDTYGITASANVEFLETPKEAKYFERVTNILFLSNQDALFAMRDEAEKRGYAVIRSDDCLTGESRDTGHAIAEKLHQAAAHTAILCAGETTVTLPETAGAGGRNQEMALAALAHIHTGEIIMPFASDGHDNTDAAGAIADEVALENARVKDLSISDYLDAHRSYEFFAATGDALLTGYTGSNVSDLIVALKK